MIGIVNVNDDVEVRPVKVDIDYQGESVYVRPHRRRLKWLSKDEGICVVDGHENDVNGDADGDH